MWGPQAAFTSEQLPTKLGRSHDAPRCPHLPCVHGTEGKVPEGGIALRLLTFSRLESHTQRQQRGVSGGTESAVWTVFNLHESQFPSAEPLAGAAGH